MIITSSASVIGQRVIRDQASGLAVRRFADTHTARFASATYTVDSSHNKNRNMSAVNREYCIRIPWVHGL